MLPVLKGKEGRPTVIDKLVLSRLISTFQKGLPDSLACKVAGISRDTYYRHYKTDREFRRAIDHAKSIPLLLAADQIFDVLYDIQREKKGEKRKYSKYVAFKTASWYLEHKDPIGWGRFVCKNECCQQKLRQTLTDIL